MAITDCLNSLTMVFVRSKLSSARIGALLRTRLLFGANFLLSSFGGSYKLQKEGASPQLLNNVAVPLFVPSQFHDFLLVLF